MPQHFEVRPTEGDGWFVDVSVSSYRLHKVIVESNNKPSQMDRLDLRGKIVSPNKLWGHRIIVELYKREEPQISVIEGYKGIGKLFSGRMLYFLKLRVSALPEDTLPPPSMWASRFLTISQISLSPWRARLVLLEIYS